MVFSFFIIGQSVLSLWLQKVKFVLGPDKLFTKHFVSNESVALKLFTEQHDL